MRTAAGAAAARRVAGLERQDKWFLGSGGPLLWAPPFPRALDRPGFWDRAHYLGFALEPLFAVTLLDVEEREIPLRLTRRAWEPTGLTQTYQAPDGLQLLEERVVTPTGAAVAELTLANLFERLPPLTLVVWSAQPGAVALQDGVHLVRRRLEHPRVPPLDVVLALGVDRRPDALDVVPSDHAIATAEWAASPLATAGRASSAAGGLSYLAQRLHLPPSPLLLRQLRVACAVAPTAAEARERLERALGSRRAPRVRSQTRGAWTRFFGRVPRFACSDPYLERAYWYRWYTIFLNTVEAPEASYRHPFVCEGIDYFRAPISYSAPAILRELRWLDSPRLGQGLVRTLLDQQRPDGSIPGHVFATGVRPESFYHADWAGGLRALEQVHPDPAFRAAVTPALERYAAFLSQTRDPDESGLVEVWNQFETGQEYSPRYAFAQPDAAEATWGEAFRLKGVDVSVYAYRLYRWLAACAARDGDPTRATRWEVLAARCGRALLERCWDQRRGFFVDVLPGSFARSPVRAATGFYPFVTDLVGPRHLAALREHLFDPASFWTPYPVPTVSVDDPLFSAEGVWRGERRNCPWNGRVWPMVNSHLVEALVEAGERLDPALLDRAADLLRRFARMLFWDGDPARPNCFEHYHPFDGTPSAFRGIDDYVHSWLADLLIQYACGLRPTDDDTIVVRPLPLGLERFALEGAPLRGRRVDVRWERGSGLRLYRDGTLVAERPDLGPLSAPLDA